MRMDTGQRDWFRGEKPLTLRDDLGALRECAKSVSIASRSVVVPRNLAKSRSKKNGFMSNGLAWSNV
jgi:hypothetical protein